jgi:hypothetical protein
MNDGLYKHHMLDATRRKEQGILQFSDVGEKRGDEERRALKLKEFKKPVHDPIALMLRDNQENNLFKSGSGSNLNKSSKYVNPDVKTVSMKKQYARVNAKSSHLPVHMQNINGRIALCNNTFQSLQANNFKERPFIDPVSTLNTRKDFRFNNLNKKTNVAAKPGSQPVKSKKKNLTFNQLLSKFGYI